MTKREKEKQECEMLKQMIKDHPKLKSFLLVCLRLKEFNLHEYEEDIKDDNESIESN